LLLNRQLSLLLSSYLSAVLVCSVFEIKTPVYTLSLSSKLYDIVFIKARQLLDAEMSNKCVNKGYVSMNL